MKKILFLPPPMSLAGISVEMAEDYDKLVNITSLTDVLKYHLFNVTLNLPEIGLTDFKLNALEEKNQAFVQRHIEQYKILCKQTKEDDEFLNASGSMDINTMNGDVVSVSFYGDGVIDITEKFVKSYSDLLGMSALLQDCKNTLRKFYIS